MCGCEEVDGGRGGETGGAETTCRECGHRGTTEERCTGLTMGYFDFV